MNRLVDESRYENGAMYVPDSNDPDHVEAAEKGNSLRKKFVNLPFGIRFYQSDGGEWYCTSEPQMQVDLGTNKLHDFDRICHEHGWELASIKHFDDDGYPYLVARWRRTTPPLW